MVTTGIACGAVLLLALVIGAREIHLWRTRDESDSLVFRYTRRRLVRRALGALALALVAVMVFLGLEVLDFSGHLVLLQVWWSIVGLLCLMLLVIPILDFRETYRHIARDTAAKHMAEEIERLREERKK